MEKTIICIGREYGSGGHEIGELLAKRTGYAFYDKEKLFEIAKMRGYEKEMQEYLDEQPVDAGGYVAGAVALESGDINSAGVAMFKIKPQTSNVRLYWAGDLPGSLTAEELRNADRNAVLEADGQARSGEGVNISYTYKKKGFLWDKTCDGLPTKPGTYTQVAKVSGNYSCSEISRTFTIYQ